MPHRTAHRTRIIAACVMVATALAATPSSASDPNEKRVWRSAAREADAVVSGTLHGIESRWAGKRIVTTADVTVDLTVKGRTEPSVRVNVPGGHVERPVPISMVVADAPTLAESEEALFFLRDKGDGTFTLRAKLPLLRDPASGAKHVALGHRSVPVEALEKKQRAFEERAGKKAPPPPDRAPR